MTIGRAGSAGALYVGLKRKTMTYDTFDRWSSELLTTPGICIATISYVVIRQKKPQVLKDVHYSNLLWSSLVQHQSCVTFKKYSFWRVTDSNPHGLEEWVSTLLPWCQLRPNQYAIATGAMHFVSKSIPHPHDPEASVWNKMSNGESELLQYSKLKPFQVLRKKCHQHRSDRNNLSFLVFFKSVASWLVL